MLCAVLCPTHFICSQSLPTSFFDMHMQKGYLFLLFSLTLRTLSICILFTTFENFILMSRQPYDIQLHMREMHVDIIFTSKMKNKIQFLIEEMKILCAIKFPIKRLGLLGCRLCIRQNYNRARRKSTTK